MERFVQTNVLSKVVRRNDHVWVSGLTANDKTGDVGAQTSDILQQFDEYLAIAGTDRNRLIRVNVWLADIRDFPAMNAAWEAWVPKDNLPARATVEAKLGGQNSLVEMMAEAFV
ncbi:enamine deaminase RidA (YjgF/YER057c/UK114 family) [Primorskyibacter sedentarius]|uniref:Enamine deaminase RidA (YjgF/YER057c/UK114 family) n=1 Tax=Primorskyibacter sedentarius TaxID=745311 RepID=A0A4R3IXK2_9RHOB|nr:RidA family protein [Primorskyibacter sedentarius]TCS55257.1 enamine deaminase RidA (YjgF/YER057c/UK114 family) [Primorskyibacter sedentarius]